MVEKPKQSREPKRLNRTVPVAEAISGILGSALKKRGFASRDIITHWGAMAPAPYDKVALPDRLAWPRAERGAEGATLYLRCAPGHALALAHEGQAVAAAINRYFGYVLVGQVRLSAEPFTPYSGENPHSLRKPTEAERITVAARIGKVEDEGIREALRGLGHALAAKTRK